MRARFSPLFLVVALALMAWPAVAQDATCAASDEALADSDFYEVISTNEVEIPEDTYWEVVKTEDGSVAIRIGKDADVSLYCRCLVPSVCTENSCEVTGTGTGNARCRGGCYQANGEACVSCRFFNTKE